MTFAALFVEYCAALADGPRTPGNVSLAGSLRGLRRGIRLHRLFIGDRG